MELSLVAPELRTGVRFMPSVPIASTLGRRCIQAGMRLAFHGKRYEGIRIEKRTTAENVTLRLYLRDGGGTERPLAGRMGPALLWVHGGGMVIGSAVQDDPFCVEIARRLGIIVVSVEYRLAPDFPFPAALDDCYAAWNWLQQHASTFQIDPTRLAIGGQSAGGGLAASLVQRIHDSGATSTIQPVAQWLFCPMLDDRTAAHRELDKIRHKVWNNRLNRIGWSAFLGTDPGAERVPEYAVPARREDLHGLPPTWIGAGDIELFFAEDQAYADRLRAAGVDITLDIVPGAYHGFERLAVKSKLAQDYLTRSSQWLSKRLALSVFPECQ